jgi:hypothetical protein
MLGITVICVAAVVIAALARIARSAPGRPEIRTGATALSIVMPLGIAIFALAGPLQKGWASRARTPASLLGAHGASASPRTAPARATTAAKGPLDRAFSTTVQGSVSQNNAGSGAIVELDMQLGGGGQMRVRLGGAPLPQGGLSLTGSQVAITAAGMPSAAVGRVISLDGGHLVARVTDASGSVVDLNANVSIDQNSGAVSGTLSGAPVGG